MHPPTDAGEPVPVHPPMDTGEQKTKENRGEPQEYDIIEAFNDQKTCHLCKRRIMPGKNKIVYCKCSNFVHSKCQERFHCKVKV